MLVMLGIKIMPLRIDKMIKIEWSMSITFINISLIFNVKLNTFSHNTSITLITICNQ